MRFRFITATPLEIRRGSGTYVGIRTLAESLRAAGHEVILTTPRLRLPVFTAERLLFNAMLRPQPCDVTVGFDMDGYRLPPHVVALKGVIADEMGHERGFTQASMGMQARCEALHARRAKVVLCTSRYSAERAAECYGLAKPPTIVPELIDLAQWRSLLAAHPAPPEPGRFAVLFVGRLYRRKRADLLVRAAALLEQRIPELDVRIVGDGPCAADWRRIGRGPRVHFLGDVSRAALAREYNRCDVFCLPSVQEGFGIVFLEAMAAGKPIVAARAGASPETVPHAALAEPGSAESLAAEILRLYEDPARRAAMATEGLRRVELYDAPRVAGVFAKLTAP